MMIFVSKDPYMYGLQSTKIKALIREDFFYGNEFSIKILMRLSTVYYAKVGKNYRKWEYNLYDLT